MGPEHDVRSVAGRGKLLKFFFHLVRMSNLDRDPGILGKFFTNFCKAVVALVTVDPDEQFTLFHIRHCRRGQRCDCKSSDN